MSFGRIDSSRGVVKGRRLYASMNTISMTLRNNTLRHSIMCLLYIVRISTSLVEEDVRPPAEDGGRHVAMLERGRLPQIDIMLKMLS